jgi:hypothetical protein
MDTNMFEKLAAGIEDGGSTFSISPQKTLALLSQP